MLKEISCLLKLYSSSKIMWEEDLHRSSTSSRNTNSSRISSNSNFKLNNNFKINLDHHGSNNRESPNMSDSKLPPSSDHILTSNEIHLSRILTPPLPGLVSNLSRHHNPTIPLPGQACSHNLLPFLHGNYLHKLKAIRGKISRSSGSNPKTFLTSAPNNYCLTSSKRKLKTLWWRS